ncbi:hypothetical protein [Virgibacillus pantothenticus]|uniref:hypothetical protein n=1 Tax=Virgibacillus pantothenticus TaxID=1473 RepID=UPI0009852B54|nr:hypothetical protein [Virgibacillus pantothenticus]
MESLQYSDVKTLANCFLGIYYHEDCLEDMVKDIEDYLEDNNFSRDSLVSYIEKDYETINFFNIYKELSVEFKVEGEETQTIRAYFLAEWINEGEEAKEKVIAFSMDD